MRNHAPLPIALAMTAVAAASACSGAGGVTDAGRDFSDAFPENRGTLVYEGSPSANQLLWWESATELVDVLAVSPMSASAAQPAGLYVRATNVDARTTRLMHGPRAFGGELSGVIVAPDGVTTFVVSSVLGPTGRVTPLHHAGPGTTSTLVTPSAGLLGSQKHSPFGMSIVVSPDSKSAAYIAAPDSLKVYDVSLRTSRPLATGCTSVLAFAPDGQRVLCASSVGAYSLVTVATGASVSAGSRTPDIHLMHLGSGGLQQLRSGAFFVTDIVNTTTGATTNIITRDQLKSGEFPEFQRGTWSSDGRRVAFAASHTCGAFSGCPFAQSSIYVVDIASRRLQRVAVINFPSNSSASIDAIAFAPDGNRVAYVAQWNAMRSAYVASIP
ncbi:MAG: hypothetical protein V4617_10680 [Gemmatimonadota bacterium]